MSLLPLPPSIPPSKYNSRPTTSFIFRSVCSTIINKNVELWTLYFFGLKLYLRVIIYKLNDNKINLQLCENSPSINLACIERFWLTSLILFCTCTPLLWRIWITWADPVPFSVPRAIDDGDDNVLALGKRVLSWLELTTMTFGPVVPPFPMLPWEIVRIPLIVVDEIPFAMGRTSGPVLVTFNAKWSGQFIFVRDYIN